jgi:hypothetical protein
LKTWHKNIYKKSETYKIWHVEKSKSTLNLKSGNIRVIEKDGLDLFPLNKK